VIWDTHRCFPAPNVLFGSARVAHHFRVSPNIEGAPPFLPAFGERVGVNFTDDGMGNVTDT